MSASAPRLSSQIAAISRLRSPQLQVLLVGSEIRPRYIFVAAEMPTAKLAIVRISSHKIEVCRTYFCLAVRGPDLRPLLRTILREQKNCITKATSHRSHVVQTLFHCRRMRHISRMALEPTRPVLDHGLGWASKLSTHCHQARLQYSSLALNSVLHEAR